MAAPVRQFWLEPIKHGFGWRQNQESKVWTERIYSSQFTGGSSTTATLVLANFPGGLVIEGAGCWAPLKWLGGSISAVTLSLGITGGSATGLINAQDVFTNSGVLQPGVTQVPYTALSTATTPNAAGSVTVTITTTTANTSALTQGSADIFLTLRGLRLK